MEILTLEQLNKMTRRERCEYYEKYDEFIEPILNEIKKLFGNFGESELQERRIEDFLNKISALSYNHILIFKDILETNNYVKYLKDFKNFEEVNTYCNNVEIKKDYFACFFLIENL